MVRKIRGKVGGLLAAIAVTLSSSIWAASLEEIGHVHALEAGDRPGELLLAAHDGLYRLAGEGGFVRVGGIDHDLLGLVRRTDGALLTSGVEASGKMLGVLRSRDGGATWEKAAAGGDSTEVLYHFSVGGGGRTLYGVYQGIYRSDDGGGAWRKVASGPEKLYHLAASSRDSDSIYAATHGGLLRSTDGGATWAPVHPAAAPATAVIVENGTVTAFIVGEGLVKADEETLQWQALSNPFGSQAPVDLVDIGDRLVALTNAMKLLESRDGGRTWQPWGGEPVLSTAEARRGRVLYKQNCQVCHGNYGMGETLVWGDRTKALAASLDDSTHAWHHTDEQLVETILEGLPEGSGRMVGWKGRLTPDQAGDIVAYIKSLWGKRALACQGPKHMSCP